MSNAACRVGASLILQRLSLEAFQNLLFPPCDGIESGNPLAGSSYEVSGQPIFPETVQAWNISDTVVNVNCNNPGSYQLLYMFTWWLITSDEQNLSRLFRFNVMKKLGLTVSRTSLIVVRAYFFRFCMLCFCFVFLGILFFVLLLVFFLFCFLVNNRICSSLCL